MDSGGHQFRFGMVGMTKLIASFPYFLILLKNAVHRSPRAEVTFLVEQCSVDLARRLISKARAVESLSDNRLLLLAERARRTRRRRRRVYLRRWDLTAPIETAARNRQSLTGRSDANLRGQFRDGGHCGSSFFWPLGSGRPSRSERFFWTSIMVSARLCSASRRSIRRRKAAFSLANGSGLGPRFLGDSAFRAPLAICWRQWVRFDE